MRNRVKNARIDSDTRQFDIEAVRKMLFEKGINITSVKIDRILGPTSAVPTRVCILLFLLAQDSHYLNRMLFLNLLNALANSNSIFISS